MKHLSLALSVMLLLSHGCSPQLLDSLNTLSSSSTTPKPPVKTESTPTVMEAVGSDTAMAIIRGKVNLPPVHPRNLYPAQLANGGEMVGHNVMGVSAEELNQIKHRHRPSYQVKEASQLRLDRLLTVRAVPIQGADFQTQQLPPPPLFKPLKPLKPPLVPSSPVPSRAEPQPTATPQNSSSPLPVMTTNTEESADTQIYGGTIDRRGNFELRVPAHKQGYVLSISGGKVRFKYRLRQEIKAGHIYSQVEAGVQSTLIANAALQLKSAAHALSNADIEKQLGGSLSAEVESLKNALQGNLRGHQWLSKSRQLIAQAGFRTASHPSTVGTATMADFFNGCTRATDGTHPAATTCYTNSDEEIYNLTAASELSGSVTAVDFSATASSATRLSTYATSGVVFGVYTQAAPQPTRNAAAGTVETSAGRLTINGGKLTVRPATTGSSINQWTGVDLTFVPTTRGGTAPAVQSVGLKIKANNGKRYPFRFIPLDSGGSEIHEYRWYTTKSTESNGFYGITVPASKATIGGLRIEFRVPNQNNTGYDPTFWIDDLTYSTAYMGTNTMDTSGSSLLANLGWRASGQWSKGSSAASSFNHPYNDGFVEYDNGSSRTASGATTSTIRSAYTSSGESYWQCSYGTSSTGDTLTSPAFSLGNLDLDTDDQTGSSTSYNGLLPGGQDPANTNVTLAVSGAPAGYPTSYNSLTLPFCRIGLSSRCPATYINASAQKWPDVYTVAPMGTHWGHVHWQSYIAVEDAAEVSNVSGSTERYVEYSMDNGTTWRKATWFEDENHHGKNGYWWKNHMHPYPDSDLSDDTNSYDFSGDGAATKSTDFDKDGTADYSAAFDNNGDGSIDSSDNREWDTEWYMEWIDPTSWTDVDSDSYLESAIEGATVSYRFRFAAPGAAPTSCKYDATGTNISACDGWKVDDVAFSNDTPRVGYYTNFNGSYDYNAD